MMNRQLLLSPPASLVEYGQVHYGNFTTPLRNPNLMDAPGILKRYRRMRLKEWQHWALIHRDYYISIALVDAKFLTNAWVSVFHRHTGTLYEHSTTRPLSTHLPGDIYDGHTSSHIRGIHIEITNQLTQAQHTLQFRATPKKNLEVSGKIDIVQDTSRVPALTSSLKISPGRPLYSHKAICFPKGEICIGDTTIQLAPDRDFALLDEHKAFYPRDTFWKWATFATHDQQANILGINLTHNMIADDRTHNENAIWYNNTLTLLGPARFEIPKDPLQDWHVHTEDRRVDLSFTPLGMRQQNIRLPIFSSRFHQPIGLFNGVIHTDKAHHVVDALGVTEDHRVRW